jgi:hypothetical protein
MDEKVGVIESGIPVPSRQKTKYPYGAMKTGDSILIPVAAFRTPYTYTRAHPAFRFTTRRCGDYVRVWRVAVKEPEKS